MPSTTLRLLHRHAVRASIKDVFALAVIVALAFMTVVMGLVPGSRYTHDSFIPLDGAWRVLNGERPHADFFTGLGPVFYLMEAAGLRFAGNTANSFYLTGLIAALAASLWGYLMVRDRFPYWLSVAFIVFLFILSSAPIAVGDPYAPPLFTYAMAYNRWGFALLSIVLVECITYKQSAPLPAFSSGVITAILTFLKASFLPVAVCIIALQFVLNRDWRRIPWLLSGFLLVTVGMLAWLRFDLAAIWNDLRIVAVCRSGRITTDRLLEIATGQWHTLAAMVMVCASLVLLPARKERPRWAVYALYGMLLYALGVLLIVSNWQAVAMPLSLTFLLICASELWAVPRTAAPFTKLASQCVALGACCLVVWWMSADLDAFRKGLRWRYYEGNTPEAIVFTAPPLRPLVTYGPQERPDRPADGKWLGEYVNDGVTLLRRYTTKQDRVLTLDYINPFSFALQTPPARGGATWLTYDDSFTDRAHPSPESLFGDASAVMVPKWPTASAVSFQKILEVYGPYVDEHFRTAGESSYWILKKRSGRS